MQQEMKSSWPLKSVMAREARIKLMGLMNRSSNSSGEYLYDLLAVHNSVQLGEVFGSVGKVLVTKVDYLT
jgi:hypothetical protein